VDLLNMLLDKFSSYSYVFLTVALTVYGQIVNKWQVNAAGAFPTNPVDKLWFLFRLLLNPWVISAFASAFFGGLAWMAALTKLPLTYAYPVFISSTFVLVVLLSSIFFKEALTLPRIIGMGLIMAGIIIGSQE